MEGVCGLLQLNFHGWKSFAFHPGGRRLYVGPYRMTLCRLVYRRKRVAASPTFFSGYSPLGGSGCTFCLSPPLCAQVRHLACHPAPFSAEIYEDNAPCRNAPVFPLPDMSQKQELSAFAEITQRYGSILRYIGHTSVYPARAGCIGTGPGFFRSMTLRHTARRQVTGQPIHDITAYACHGCLCPRAYCAAPSVELLERYVLLRHLEGTEHRI